MLFSVLVLLVFSLPFLVVLEVALVTIASPPFLSLYTLKLGITISLSLAPEFLAKLLGSSVVEID